MSAVADTLRRVTGRTSDVVDRVEGLQRAVDAARGRIERSLTDEADAVVERAAGRLRLSDQHTVVALAGATGSGKSSLFNALCGLELAAVGVKRPTTSWALACSWGPEGAGELLDWLGIPKRHQVNRMSMLDESAEERGMRGLVLLDLPDHDSTEVSHHLEVQRLVTLADVLVWVLDPQKYADAAIHDRFLRPLSTHADVMVVVLNHIDEIPAGGADACMSDVSRLLSLDGLAGVPVFGTSATRGDGLAELRKALVDRVAKKRLARTRLAADVTSVARKLEQQTGSATPGDLRDHVRDELLDAAIQAAGVPVVVDAIQSATSLRARQATGWPVTAWLSRLRRDPLRRLRLSSGVAESTDARIAQAVQRHAIQARMPVPESVQRARLDAAVRVAADEVTAGMSPPWETAIRTASASRVSRLTDALNAAVSGTDLGVSTDPWWWRVARVLQWLLFLTALSGGLWLAALAGVSYLQLSLSDPVDVGGFPLPTLMLIGGIIVGVLLAFGCRLLADVSARRRAQRAGARLRASIAEVTDELIVRPMQAEIDAYLRCRQGLDAALRR
ncbi:MAG: 50S ribosome-binding GTPase [Propionibacteriales bacterium]|nr:50S ribosome-binding GTPase [Propionibacteriales bacterium]